MVACFTSAARDLLRRRSGRAGSFSSSIALWTCSRSLGLTGRLLFRTRDTVAIETPALAAIRETYMRKVSLPVGKQANQPVRRRRRASSAAPLKIAKPQADGSGTVATPLKLAFVDEAAPKTTPGNGAPWS